MTVIAYLITVLVIYGALFSNSTKNMPPTVLSHALLAFITLHVIKNFIFLMISPWHQKKDKVSTLRKNSPLVSIIIPAWNEEIGIIGTLKSVLQSSYRNIELIVVDDGSTDKTKYLIQKYIAKINDSRAKYISQLNAGKGAALNCGIRHSSGDIVTTIDADSIVDTNAIKNIVKKFDDPKVMGVNGRVVIGNNTGWITKAQSIEYNNTFYFKHAEALMDSLYIVGGAAAAYRRKVFEKIGFFDTESITEDIDFSLRMKRAGMCIDYAEDALIITEAAHNYNDLLKQRTRWKCGRYQVLLMNRDMFFTRSVSGNGLLSLVYLPFSIFQELSVAIEPFLVILIAGISIVTNNYMSILLMITITALTSLISVLQVSGFTKRNLKYIPISWLLGLTTTVVEYIATLKTLVLIKRGNTIRWQRWNRKGALSSNVTGVSFYLTYVVSILIPIYFLILALGFYSIAIITNILSTPFIIAIIYIFATDVLFLSFHIFRKEHTHKNLILDPTKLTILIICHNGEKLIGETIEQATTHVDRSQIIVVSDFSTDNTADIAHKHGAEVFETTKNLNKALSINQVSSQIKTDYVLILDDDTHIKDTIIPTNLLDEGYSAVAFNVMPEKRSSLVNSMQQFEYRKAMFLGKALRSSVGAIGNVSGAIGLFRTKDIKRQAKIHSGQFGGEDQQRTTLVQLMNGAIDDTNKGITYIDSLVLTEPPETWRSLFKQRSKRWGMSVHENFVLFFKLIFSKQVHPLLKFERAYLLFVFITDPLRMVLFPFLILRPREFILFYILYTFLEFIAWLRTGRKDPWYIILMSPFYSIFRNVARFVAHFYWFKVKFQYIFSKKFHRMISERKLIYEYAFITLMLLIIWGVVIYFFVYDIISPV